jgi:hypothetical protein
MKNSDERASYSKEWFVYTFRKVRNRKESQKP